MTSRELRSLAVLAIYNSVFFIRIDTDISFCVGKTNTNCHCFARFAKVYTPLVQMPIKLNHYQVFSTLEIEDFLNKVLAQCVSFLKIWTYRKYNKMFEKTLLFANQIYLRTTRDE